MRALRRKGLTVQPFKCGPDYIDPGHHRAAAGRPSRNLDCWMMGEEGVRRSFARAAADADCAVVEGVMGLFDGAFSGKIDGSTAHVAKLLGIPVILVVNAKAMARSLAALVHGFATFEPGVEIVGVIANNVSSPKHEGLLKEALTAAQLPPLLGAIPHEKKLELPERHLGLLPSPESKLDDEWHERLADLVEQHVDIDLLLKLSGEDGSPSRARGGEAVPERPFDFVEAASCRFTCGGTPHLGIARDEAFNFYYEDNLDLLRESGVVLVPFSPIHDERLPDGLDGLYLGGGFPEMFAPQLARNTSMRQAVKAFADADGSIFAECGGLMYLCEAIEDAAKTRHMMCGVIPAVARMGSKLRRLGYVEAKTSGDSFFGSAGTVIRGHEFHWSDVELTGSGASPEPAFRTRGASGGDWTPMGFHVGKVIASYFHAHFLSSPTAAAAWASSLRGE